MANASHLPVDHGGSLLRPKELREARFRLRGVHDALRQELARLRGLFPVVPETPAVFPEWLRLVITHGVVGLRVYDARLVAVMVVHGITHLLTFNADDFRSYPDISVVDPRDPVPPGAEAARTARPHPGIRGELT